MPGNCFILEPSGRRSPVFRKGFEEAFRGVIYRNKPEYPVDVVGINGKRGMGVATLIKVFSLEGATLLTAEFFTRSHHLQV